MVNVYLTYLFTDVVDGAVNHGPDCGQGFVERFCDFFVGELVFPFEQEHDLCLFGQVRDNLFYHFCPVFEE